MSEKKITVTYKVIRRLIEFFYHKPYIDGVENIPDEACIVVGNHAHMNGPIISELYLPGHNVTWCAGQMMTRKEVSEYAFQDFWSQKPAYIRWLFRLISYIIPPISTSVFNSASTIPVYHDNRIITTFRQSIETLNEGKNIVIFPECYDEHNEIVHEFQEKFVDLARFYYKKTGRELMFVPLYNAPALHRSCYGRPVRFDHNAKPEEERRRICEYLMDEITGMAKALPRHRVVPYPNVSKRHYPYSKEVGQQ